MNSSLGLLQYILGHVNKKTAGCHFKKPSTYIKNGFKIISWYFYELVPQKHEYMAPDVCDGTYVNVKNVFILPF